MPCGSVGGASSGKDGSPAGAAVGSDPLSDVPDGRGPGVGGPAIVGMGCVAAMVGGGSVSVGVAVGGGSVGVAVGIGSVGVAVGVAVGVPVGSGVFVGMGVDVTSGDRNSDRATALPGNDQASRVATATRAGNIKTTRRRVCTAVLASQLMTDTLTL